MLRNVIWRSAAIAAALIGLRLVLRLLHGSIGSALRDAGRSSPGDRGVSRLPAQGAHAVAAAAPWLALPLAAGLALAGTVTMSRLLARRRRRYVRQTVLPYRTDHAESPALARMYTALHAGLIERWWRRLLSGQPSAALEARIEPSAPAEARLSISCPAERVTVVESAMRAAYPNVRLVIEVESSEPPAVLLRLRKHRGFIRRTATSERPERDAQPAIDGLLRAMAATAQPALVQIALTPAPSAVEWLARALFKRREAELSRERRRHPVMQDRSMVEDAELRGGLAVQHRALFFADIRVLATRRADSERIASSLRAHRAENRLVERGTPVRHGRLGLLRRRLQRGEGNPLPGLMRNVFAPTELAELWQLPSVEFAAVPLARSSLPLAPAPPEILRPAMGEGSLRDAFGPLSIHAELRRQNVAVPGTVEQGKSSFLVASVAEDLRRERCAVIVLDPKGDAAEAALSAVPPGRTCTLLDLADPTCGFNPLHVDAPADVIADYVVAALKNLFDQADIRASSDRYLRNAVIAVLAHDRNSTLWDAARLLSVGEEGYAYRRAVGAAVRSLPELKEISSFFTSELSAQLADARSATTAKLDAPANKLARLLNSPSIKRVLLNRSLLLDFDRVISEAQVVVVKGALGSMGAGNTAVVMQLLVGMLDAALARQQDLVPAPERVAVALKVDEAPLVLNRGFAETMALKRSAGLETLACWQTDSQWTDREVHDQLDALFAHRVYFATASSTDARRGADLAMTQFSDAVRPGVERLSALAHPDVRLRLPRHHAIVSWVTPSGRAAAFLAETVPMRVDRARIAELAAEQSARGGKHLSDLRQPPWDRPLAGEVPSVSRDAPPEPRPPEPGHAAAGAGAGGLAPCERVPRLPVSLASTYRELVDLDRARALRHVAAPREATLLSELDGQDVELLSLLATLGHLLSSQIHRRLAPAKAPTTTQRRLKRLADAGLIARLQFHRPDGGGVPMCCTLAPAGWAALQSRAPDLAVLGASAIEPHPRDGGGLRQLRHELHVAGWALACAARAAGVELRGRVASVLPPPSAPSRSARAFGPAELRLPGGRVPHDFVRTVGERRVEADRFQTLRPDATVSVRSTGGGCCDLLIERDDRGRAPGWVAKLERYDHFLTGWSAHTRRYGPGGASRPLAVFVCGDRRRARECAHRADGILRACRAYAGDYPHSWEYVGRGSTVFVAERDIHEGELCGWTVPELPPELRSRLADGDPRAAQQRSIAVTLPAAGPG